MSRVCYNDQGADKHDNRIAEQEKRHAEAAAKTITVGAFYFYHPAERKARARKALRHIANCESYKKEDGMADVFLEWLWNIMSGSNEG